jgi:hypothetical protein
MDSWDEAFERTWRYYVRVRGMLAIMVCSFSDDICTTLVSYPYFVYLVRIDIPSSAGTYCLLGCVGVIRVCVCNGAVKHEMCGFAAVLVWRVVCVARRYLVCVDAATNVVYSRTIRPGKDVAEAPGSDLALCFFP